MAFLRAFIVVSALASSCRLGGDLALERYCMHWQPCLNKPYNISTSGNQNHHSSCEGRFPDMLATTFPVTEPYAREIAPVPMTRFSVLLKIYIKISLESKHFSTLKEFHQILNDITSHFFWRSYVRKNNLGIL